MIYVYPALVTRLEADATWVQWCRKLYRGFGGRPEKAVYPYVEVDCDDSAPFDSFSTDGMTYALEFVLFGKGTQQPAWCDQMIQETIRLLDHANLLGPLYISDPGPPPVMARRFTCAGMSRTSTGQPKLEDGLYQARMSYTLRIQLTTKVPATRDT